VNNTELIGRLRESLQPQGSLNVVGIRTRQPDLWLYEDFVSGCIDELERMPMRIALGEGPTNLEKLAIQLLLDSANIRLEKK
jgi:hypothetical protein